jgi:hypothetical protein
MALRVLMVDDHPIGLVSSRSASDYGDQIGLSGAAGFGPKAELYGDAVRALLEGAPRR